MAVLAVSLFSLSMGVTTFSMRWCTCKVCALYIMKPIFDGSGKVCSLDLQTFAFGCNIFMCSWKCLLNILMSSESPLISILMLNLRSLDMGVPSSAHLLKLSISRRALPLSQVRSSASLIVSLDRDRFDSKEIGVTPSTPS